MKAKDEMDYLIREGTSADCQAIYDLICDMEETELPYKPFRYENQLHHAACIAEIMECAVDKSVRSEGIGKLLIDQACLHARNSGCIQIEVACNQLREKAHKFYEREGMNNYHYKFSKPLVGKCAVQNCIGL